MAIIDCQASFSNSRIKPRAATTEGATFNKIIAPVSALLFAYNENRTTLTIRNESLGVDFRYSYSLGGASQTIGFLVRFGEAVELQGPMAVYACSCSLIDSVEICADEGAG